MNGRCNKVRTSTGQVIRTSRSSFAGGLSVSAGACILSTRGIYLLGPKSCFGGVLPSFYTPVLTVWSCHPARPCSKFPVPAHRRSPCSDSRNAILIILRWLMYNNDYTRGKLCILAYISLLSTLNTLILTVRQPKFALPSSLDSSQR
jgi:hypothetical protein